MSEPANSLKAEFTSTVAGYEQNVHKPVPAGAPASFWADIGGSLLDQLSNTPSWSDSSSGYFGDGWDTSANLRRRVLEARAVAINASRGWDAPPPEVSPDPGWAHPIDKVGYLWSRASSGPSSDPGPGLTEQAAHFADENIGRPILNAAKAAKDAATNSGWVVPAVLALLTLAVAGGLFFRARG